DRGDCFKLSLPIFDLGEGETIATIADLRKGKIQIFVIGQFWVAKRSGTDFSLCYCGIHRLMIVLPPPVTEALQIFLVKFEAQKKTQN
ncbi:MAG TPA: hypothetical protein VM866_06360, partial [Pyrinomonadaceae bacterium]|nr:hypothetical protein [Pyrinomonadaceae bacterium]